MRKTILIVALVVALGATSASAQDDLLNSIGALGAGYMYTSYLAIGAVADGHYFEVYDDETTMQLMEEIKGIANGTSYSLLQLLENENLAIEDFNFINDDDRDPRIALPRGGELSGIRADWRGSGGHIIRQLPKQRLGQDHRPSGDRGTGRGINNTALPRCL